MSKIQSETPIKSDWTALKFDFSFELVSAQRNSNPKISVEASEEGVRKICYELPQDDFNKLLECWREKVKALWLSLDEEFVFSRDNHVHKDYTGMSDFERLSQESNDGNYPL
ncbi:MAG: hypothetical protein COZ49_00935 [Candidatus Yonathbacteria bacterium CG_4_10_14_3_um_filter_47_65]|uniref:Uncharacterized protein n=1 Tax=Candidatus Yonathbacteria bacterium CG_4_9_14_0_8_um_filter_46_47 TaxID=1975106 RepID=A0A2M8D969_9BACT|nr:MAG: hypothetical protein COX54_04555 [Candidatus Yonathbacteria bacterium CG23_combo_of_CG06-09_8_20_14_all_46_18]PIQ31750.1 MAG: hypothetical protein COW61_03455 [Candidatus Yonathbacteria bacterium CG17_big_fil_post_rev_8_21_14_2_50_46_19]PIX56658.1 MAG: hypothetical protein COZ49_00935 [Candidatus Yonathbacteria bacterium CG_4_10_14_3_um_filter_47_65]PJB83710.1 MAG: hypothetical protein CO088_00955 [Candidatus Yonathbacteria bacterium CG_4_9_14_0_8_um_filter_46_47]PJC20732.1 MAG: hypothe